MPEVIVEAFRRQAGLFATGVCVVTVQHEHRIFGMTANAFTSVSLAPLLVLVAFSDQAHTLAVLEESGQFAINLLSREQENVSRHFAGSARSLPEIHFEPFSGGPRLVGSLAAIGCAVDQMVTAGDHRLVIGRVIALSEPPAEGERPLVFWRGAYWRLPAGAVGPAPALEGEQIFFD